jgi:hypothetical protein
VDCNIRIGGRSAALVSTQSSGNQRIVTVQPAADETFGPKAGVISSGALNFSFSVQYTLPSALATPVDALCSGGSIINVTATGWGVDVPQSALSSVTVTIGGVRAAVSAVMASTPASTSVSLFAPVLPGPGTYPGSITYGSITSSFSFRLVS